MRRNVINNSKRIYKILGIIVMFVAIIIGGYFIYTKNILNLSILTQSAPQQIEYEEPITSVISPSGADMTILSKSSIIGKISLDNLPDIYINTHPTAKIVDSWIVSYPSINTMIDKGVLFFVISQDDVPSFWLAQLNGERPHKILSVGNFINNNISLLSDAPIFSPKGDKFIVLLKNPSFYNTSEVCNDIQDTFSGDTIRDVSVNLYGYDLTSKTELDFKLPIVSKDPTYLSSRIINAKWIDNNTVEFINSPLKYPYIDTRTNTAFGCPNKLPIEVYRISSKPAVVEPYFHTDFPTELSKQTWSEYHDKQYGFIMQYPSEWDKTTHNLDSNEILRLNSNTVDAGGDRVLMHIYVSDEKIKDIIKQEKIKEVEKHAIPGVVTQYFKMIDLGGYQGIESVFVQNLDKLEGYRSLYFIPRNGKMFQIKFEYILMYDSHSSEVFQTNTLRNLYDQILSTFEFFTHSN